MTKKPNFIDNIWAKSKNKIISATEKLGNFAGGFVGLSSAGTIAANLMEKIPIKKMATKALAAGTVSSAEVAKTLVSNNIPPTPENVKAGVELTKTTADGLAADTTNGLSNKKPTVNLSALPMKDKILYYVKTYWYVVLIVVAAVAYLIFKPKSNKRR